MYDKNNILSHIFLSFDFTMSIEINDPIKIVRVETTPIQGQKPGTSGLRKKVAVFQKPQYTQNFIQSYFNALRKDALSPKNILLVGGDGRYFTPQAIEIICQIACANGVSQLHIAKDGLMSTPACSVYIRHLNQQIGNCLGGILLTASHNPGGPHEDFGIKFNSRNGGPALEELTNLIYRESKEIKTYSLVDYTFLKTVDLSKIGEYKFNHVHRPAKHQFIIKVVQNVDFYVHLMKKEFKFDLIQNLLNRTDFPMVFDGLHGASGPYAKAIFGKQLGNKVKLINCDPTPDFNGHHPDPNLKCAEELVHLMGINEHNSIYEFGAACDGDADRNMILGRNFFVTPSDSLAVLASHSSSFLKHKLVGVARSMPTSGAVDKVAVKLGIHLYETPTGWKYFGNLMEENLIGLCGQESFGTGSPHIREKDGLWTILAWLQVLAKANEHTEIGKLIGVEAILHQFWKSFGRNYYCRYDFQNCNLDKGRECWEHIKSQIQKYNTGDIIGSVFCYKDPVDYSVSDNQGLIFKYQNGSRVIFRQSGTGTQGMTMRIYFEKYEETNVNESQFDILKEMIQFGLELSKIRQITGKQKPDVIT